MYKISSIKQYIKDLESKIDETKLLSKKVPDLKIHSYVNYSSKSIIPNKIESSNFDDSRVDLFSYRKFLINGKQIKVYRHVQVPIVSVSWNDNWQKPKPILLKFRKVDYADCDLIMSNLKKQLVTLYNSGDNVKVLNIENAPEAFRKLYNFS